MAMLCIGLLFVLAFIRPCILKLEKKLGGSGGGRAKKSNYSSTSMMERGAEGTVGVSAPLTADTDSLRREFCLL